MNNDQHAMLEVISRHVRRDPSALHAAATLADLDIDSLGFIVIILEIEQKIQRSIFDVENVGRLKTIGDILSLAADPACA